MVCDNCEIEHNGHYGSGRFCSVKCARGFSTKNKREDISKKVSQKLKGRLINPQNLFTSDHPVNLRRSTFIKKAKLRFEDEEARFGAGLFIPPTSRKAKFLLIRLRGPKCEKCNWSGTHPVTGRTIIQLDHINGDAANNHISNLRLLCPNCHAMTPTFGSLNNGNGRKERRDQYLRKTPMLASPKGEGEVS